MAYFNSTPTWGGGGEARGDAVLLGTALQAGRSRVSFHLMSLGFFTDLSGCTLALWWTQPLTE
jgi:hypothetical protein